MLFFSEWLNEIPQLAGILIKILLALLSGGVVGLERGRHGRNAGFRTHILVCMGAMLAAMLDLHIHTALGSDGTRIAAQVVTGIGFLGAGVILIKRDFTITGLTTAAGLWIISIVGLAYGYGFCEAGLLVTAATLITTTVLSKIESGQKSELSLYLELDSLAATNAVIEQLRDKCPMGHLDVVPAKSGCTEHIGIRLSFTKKTSKVSGQSADHLQEFLAIDHVIYVVAD